MAAMSNMSPQALAAWEQLNATWGKPLTVNSAYRDPAQNAAAGGAKRSQHMHGNAFDVSTAGLSPADRAALVQAANSAGFTGYGGYNNALHLDVGPRRTWGADYTGATTPDWLTSALGGNAPAMQGRTSTRGSQPMTPTQQAPKGILEMMGVQKRDPSAQDQTALPFYQRDQFRNTMGNIAMAANTLRQRPDQNIATQVQANRQQRDIEQRSSRTAQWLSQQPGGEVFVEYLNSGADPAAVLQAYQAQRASNAAAEKGTLKEVGGKLLRIMPDGSVEVAYAPDVGELTPEKATQAGALRDDLNRELGDFTTVRSSYENIMQFYSNPNAVSDYALAVAFAKVLDPGSVAREGEVLAVQNAGARIPALGQALRNAITGEGSLTLTARQQIAENAAAIYTQKANGAQATLSRYEQAAAKYAIPFDLIYFGGEVQPAQPIAPASSFLPKVPDGYDPTTWQSVYEEMTEDEKAKFQ